MYVSVSENCRVLQSVLFFIFKKNIFFTCFVSNENINTHINTNYYFYAVKYPHTRSSQNKKTTSTSTGTDTNEAASDAVPVTDKVTISPSIITLLTPLLSALTPIL